MPPVLKRVTVTFADEGIRLSALYRHNAGANPGTRRRAREVGELVRTGLRRTLEALEGGEIVMVGEAGFTMREDTLLIERKAERSN